MSNPSLQRYPGPVSQIRGMAAGVPQHLRGKPRLLIDTTMTGADLDISSAGDYVIEGNTWTIPNAVASTLIAEATGVRCVSNDAVGQRLLIEIPGVSAGSFICATVEFEVVTLASASQSVWIKLKQTNDLLNTQYDTLMACFRHSASSWRAKHGYKGSGGSLTTAYTGDNPWNDEQPTTVTMAIWGSGYSWRCSMSSVSTTPIRPSFRAMAATNNATGSLRTRSNGQTAGDALPYLRYLVVGFAGSSNTIEARVKRVIVETV